MEENILNKSVDVSLAEGNVVFNEQNITSLNNFGAPLYTSEDLKILNEDK